MGLRQVVVVPSLGLQPLCEIKIVLVDADNVASLIDDRHEVDPNVPFNFASIVKVLVDRKDIHANRVPRAAHIVKYVVEIPGVLGEAFL